MKLQLKHIQYYPIGENGLKCHLMGCHDSNEKPILLTLYGIEHTNTGVWVTCFDEKDIMDTGEIEELFPILHPLSDLTKPITVPGYNDGKEFVPIVELAKIGNRWIIEDELEDRIYFSQWDTGVCEVFVRTASPEDPRIFVFEIYDYLTQPYRIIQKLYQWHFAVDIPDGTWINIKTL